MIYTSSNILYNLSWRWYVTLPFSDLHPVEIVDRIKYRFINVFFPKFATYQRSTINKSVHSQSVSHELESLCSFQNFLKHIFGQIMLNLKIRNRWKIFKLKLTFITINIARFPIPPYLNNCDFFVQKTLLNN